ncbi:MAG: efflux RND transporter permease subunit [Chloroflexi bacterium]|nr:MAG: efflux RND transporter permease subunit [Chloroflexota bacterium]
MNAGNDPAAWQNFYIMIGTANAAITGLLFVALSLHVKQILAHPVYKPRAIVVLVILTTQIVISAIVLAPQPRELMGWEILILNAFFLALNVRHRTPARLTAGSALTIAIRVIYVLASISLITGVGGGFYILGGVLTLTLVRSIFNCWTLLTALESDTAA